MLKIEVFTPSDCGYEAACSFAHRVYKKELAFNLVEYPQLLFVISNNQEIQGCMGLNTRITFPAFLNNANFNTMVTSNKSHTLGEQSILAVQRHNLGLPLLISVVVQYAKSIGIEKIAYAGIPVSQKTISHLGFKVATCGMVDIACFPREQQHLYAQWMTLNPVVYLLDTSSACTIFSATHQKFSKKIKIGARLQQAFLPDIQRKCVNK